MNRTVVFYGDSRAADWPPPELPQFTFINRGVGGQTSAEALAVVDRTLTGLHPQIVVVQIGINDLSVLTFNPAQRQPVVTACQNNIRRLASRLGKLSEQLVFTTIFPVGDAGLLFYDTAETIDAVDEVNATIHSLAGPKVTVFDAFSILAADDGLVQPDFALDMLHLNRQGYAALNRELSGVLAKLAGPPAPA